jgi:Iodothyronine deiodinase
VLYVPKDGKEVLKKVEQTDSPEARAANAEICVTALKLSVPTVIDRDDNKVNVGYAGWPDRMYVVGMDGKVAYKGGPGPSGFKPAEVEKWMKANTLPRPRQVGR